MINNTRKFPRIIAIEIEESDEFNIKALALNLTAKVKLYEFFLCRVEAKPGHDGVVMRVDNLLVVMILVHGDGFNGHKNSSYMYEWPVNKGICVLGLTLYTCRLDAV